MKQRFSYFKHGVHDEVNTCYRRDASDSGHKSRPAEPYCNWPRYGRQRGTWPRRAQIDMKGVLST